jgi:thiol-disulfide isomerase/thioredoxin
MSAFHTLVLITGVWRAVLMTPGGELPFTLEIKEQHQRPVIYIVNGDEKMELTDIVMKQDSLLISMPVYDSQIAVKINDHTMDGVWVNYSRTNHPSLPFKAYQHTPYRFFEKPVSTIHLDEKYDWKFIDPENKDTSYAIALFKQQGAEIKATLLTSSGDYRYLHGTLNNDSLFLSYFDGAFAYLFKGNVTGSAISGMFYAGNHWQQAWVAVSNPNAALPDPLSLTFLKSDTARLQFEALTLDSTLFSYPHQKLTGQVTLIEIMGTWCPNCMDEVVFLSDWYRKNKNRNLNIIGLAFEKTSNFQKAKSNVERMKKRYQVPYETLLAGHRDQAKEKLNMLNKINAYPTTIFIDKKGKVRNIYTGFNGPATGIYYEKTKDDFIRLIEKLLSE